MEKGKIVEGKDLPKIIPHQNVLLHLSYLKSLKNQCKNELTNHSYQLIAGCYWN